MDCLGRAVDGGFEVDVAQAAFAAFGEADALAVVGEVGDDFVGVKVADEGADGHFEDDVVCTCTVAVGARGLFSPFFGLVAFDEAVFDEGVGVFVGFCPNAAAFATIATVGAAAGYEFFAAETGCAITAFACGDFDFLLRPMNFMMFSYGYSVVSDGLC